MGNILQLLDETQDTVLLYQKIENEKDMVYYLNLDYCYTYSIFPVMHTEVLHLSALWFCRLL